MTRTRLGNAYLWVVFWLTTTVMYKCELVFCWHNDSLWGLQYGEYVNRCFVNDNNSKIVLLTVVYLVDREYYGFNKTDIYTW